MKKWTNNGKHSLESQQDGKMKTTPTTITIILTSLLLSPHTATGAMAAYKTSSSNVYELNADGSFLLTAYGRWQCRRETAGPMVCPAHLQSLFTGPSGTTTLSVPIYIAYELSNDLRIDGRTKGVKSLDIAPIMVCHRKDTNMIASGQYTIGTNSCLAVPTTIKRLLTLTTTNTEGTHTGTLKYTLWGYEAKNEIPENYSESVNTTTIIYRVKDNKPVPPDTPVSCTTLTETLHFDHGTKTHNDTSGLEKITNLQVKCDGAINGTITAQGGTDTNGARVAMTNNGTAELNVQGNDGTWAGVKTIAFKSGDNYVPIRSTIIHAPGGNTYTGTTVISINYQ